MTDPIAILGCGNMGTALANILAAHGGPVRLYSIEADVTDEINQSRRNTKYLPGVELRPNVTASGDIEAVLAGAGCVLFAVPSFALKEVFESAAPLIRTDALIGCITKGFDDASGLPLGLVMAEWLGPEAGRRYCLLGGPAVATELARNKPSALLIGSRILETAKAMAALFQGDVLKADVSDDLVGISYAMVLKNIYAIALGLCEGLEFPMNTKALIMTVALKEMSQVMEAMGARPTTAMSLAALGDLVVTGFSPHGRNRTYGERLVGASTSDPRALGLTIVEGIAAAEVGHALREKLGLSLPLLSAVRACLRQDREFAKPFVDYIAKLRF